MSTEGKPPGRSVTRTDFEAVIRRAVELSQLQGDAEESVSEAELVRIGGELGLSADKVKQALYDQPQLESDPYWYDRYFERPIVSTSRVVPGRADVNLTRLEEYISAREYMQVVRRKSGELRFIPAEDAISRLARGLARPGSRFHLAHARRVIISVQQLNDTRSHIRVESDYSEQRASSVRSALWTGSFLGVISGAIPAALMTDPFTGVAAAAVFVGSLAISVGAGAGIAFKLTASSFKNRVVMARREIESLLDRAEHSDRLEPPPAPWRRSLRAKIFGR